MTAEVVIALIAGLGGFIAALVTAHNSVSKAQMERMAEEARILKEKQELAVKLEAEKREAVDESVRNEFQRLQEEIDRLDKSNERRRKENEDLYTAQTNLRRDLNSRDDELAAVKRDLAFEKSLSLAANTKAEALAKRTTDLEAKVVDLLAERDVFIAAMQKAGIEIPTFKRRGDTGPLATGP